MNDSGIVIAVAIAAVAVIIKRMAVFSETPSIVILLEDSFSHQFIFLYSFLSKVESDRAGFPARYIICPHKVMILKT